MSLSLSCAIFIRYRNLDREDLDAIGVSDLKHRDVLLGRIGPLAAAKPRRHSGSDRVKAPAIPEKKRSQTMEDPFDQFEAIFQDIDNMIGDMRSFQGSEVREESCVSGTTHVCVLAFHSRSTRAPHYQHTHVSVPKHSCFSQCPRVAFKGHC